MKEDVHVRRSNLHTFTIVVRLFETIIGIVVCCLAGIYCHEDSCTPKWMQWYKLHGQVYVVLVAAIGVGISFLFLLCRCVPFCRNHWKTTEILLINMMFALYLVAATVETFYGSGYGPRFFKNQWRAAAAFAWLNSSAFAADLAHIWCFSARIV